ncbi:MAG: ABC transporter ATP-binding protein [Negativicutes bacterium]|nr:ABC transporter ATP-binding protein [Negativicutes bacterium]
MKLLNVKNLRVSCAGQHPLVKGIDFSIKQGEWLALIGESGSGKSISAFSVGGLLSKGLSRQADEMNFLGTELMDLSEEEFRKLRGKEISYVFQDYQGAFTPYYILGRQMDEVMVAHTNWEFKERKERAVASLNDVGLAGESIYERYPFQVSGGQLQRAALALAMLLKPKLLIADEPTTALDAMSAALVLQLISKLQEETNCSILFITHDLRCVKRYADRIAIMKSGEIIETGRKKDVLMNPRELYTRNLLASIPPLRNVPRRLPILGDVDDLALEGGPCCDEI